jgi:DNA-binding response OmpR family regulator
MAWPDYKSAAALIYDPIASNRNITFASLLTLGFREVAVAGSVETLAARMEAASPDVIFCEVSGAETAICGLIQNLRQEKAGKNPFVVIIATTWTRSGTVVSQVLNSGADDLIARPVSTPLLAERLKAQVERRRAFVVTADYIGPDRRRDPARSGAECMHVPNSLKIKTSTGLDKPDAARRADAEIREARVNLNKEKMRRDAFQLCLQWRLLEQRRPGGPDFAEALTHMQSLNDDIARRAARSPHDAALQWCDSMTASLAAIRKMIDASKDDGEDGLFDLSPPMHRMGQAAVTLGRMLAPGELRSSQLSELDTLVARLAPHPALRAPSDLREKLRAAG